MNGNNQNQQLQSINLIWIVFLMNTIFLPVFGFIAIGEASKESLLFINGYILLGIGAVLFVISHMLFKKVSRRPISYKEYHTPFVFSCVSSEMITILGVLYYILTRNLDHFFVILIALGFVSVLIKKPNLQFILKPTAEAI